jgi:hypothetical protein
MGRRVQKKVYSYASSAYSLQSTRLFVYDGWNMIQEMDGTGVVQEVMHMEWTYRRARKVPVELVDFSQ